MTRLLDRQKAFDLRQQGKSYTQIKSALGISKSTLSEWLRNYPLSKEQITSLRENNQMRIERFRETMRQKREKRLRATYLKEQKDLLPLTNKELFFAGLFLYWGEGNKSLTNSISLSNTDPSVLEFTLLWMIIALKIPKNRIKVCVHLYSDMEVQKELNFWSKLLNIPLSQFRKPYIKSSTRLNITQKGNYGHGTCTLITNDVRLKEKLIMGISAIADYYRDIIHYPRASSSVG